MARAVRTPRSEYRRSSRRERVFAHAQRAMARVIRQCRDQRGLTQEQAAERIGIHPVTYGRIERGELNPTLATLCAIAYAYDLKLSDLFGPPA